MKSTGLKHNRPDQSPAQVRSPELPDSPVPASWERARRLRPSRRRRCLAVVGDRFVAFAGRCELVAAQAVGDWGVWRRACQATGLTYGIALLIVAISASSASAAIRKLEGRHLTLLTDVPP